MYINTDPECYKRKCINVFNNGNKCVGCREDINNDYKKCKPIIEESPTEDKIKDAIKLLTANGYIVTEFTKKMVQDSQKCEDSNGSKDCCGCSCNMCLVQ